ncbi:MAG TPA: hypothetical protein VIJ69_12130 [Actinomycetota bacterium]
MTDVILLATIGVFFLAAALLVRVLGRMIAGSDPEDHAGPGEDTGSLEGESRPELEPGRPR